MYREHEIMVRRMLGIELDDAWEIAPEVQRKVELAEGLCEHSGGSHGFKLQTLVMLVATCTDLKVAAPKKAEPVAEEVPSG